MRSKKKVRVRKPSCINFGIAKFHLDYDDYVWASSLPVNHFGNPVDAKKLHAWLTKAIKYLEAKS